MPKNKKKLKIVQINTVPNGSTGNIMMSIHRQLLENGYDSYVVWGRGRKAENDHEINMGHKLGIYFHVLYSRLTGMTGFASKKSTKALINKLEQIKPDVIHLHNLHGYYINIELLFKYIKNNSVKVIWTLHDCWPFTGHCCYFDVSKCKCWKGEKCIALRDYPKCFFNNSQKSYRKKKESFTNVKDLTIVTPSNWLKELVEKSFLKDYPTIVINNGIDTNVFHPIPKKKLQFRKKYNLEDKKIILGVASPWTERKGLNDFYKLSQIIDDNTRIVLVGLDKKQIKNMPMNIIGFQKTTDINELVDIYNSADIFFNPTHEDNYPTVNLEAAACNTKIITYNTGGASEIKKIYPNTTIINDISDFPKYPHDNNEKHIIKHVVVDSSNMFKEYVRQYE